MVSTEKRERNDFFRQLFFISVLVGMAIVIWQQLGFLVNSFLGASTLYIVLRSLNLKLIEQKKWKSWASSLFFVSCTLVVLLALFFLIFEIVASQIHDIDSGDIVMAFENLSETVNSFMGFKIISKNLFQQFGSAISGLASGLLNKTYSVVVNFVFMIIILYFMLAKSREMEKTLLRYTPFEGKSLSMLKNEVRTMVYSNAIGIPVVMLAQSIVAGIGYQIVGLDKVVFLAFITGIAGLIPLVGTALVWVPLVIFLFVVGNIWQAVVLLIFSIIIIANIDYVCRTILLKAMTNTHPLIVIFGVLLGLPLFGFWGIIFGPLVISGFILLLKIYNVKYNQT
ncbi:AI-2E family transporter [Bacteroidales bacterium OttesenSCG-928-I21]|nr:AI-2E family transporter [Bacteroidales bacterium OttesenSCG-928-I21]